MADRQVPRTEALVEAAIRELLLTAPLDMTDRQVLLESLGVLATTQGVAPTPGESSAGSVRQTRHTPLDRATLGDLFADHDHAPSTRL